MLRLSGPVLLAAALDVVLLSPWLFDRADLGVYTSEAFLQIKHWNATRLPSSISNVPRTAYALLGPAMLAALGLLLVLGVAGRRTIGTGNERTAIASPTANGVFLPLALSMIVVVAGALLRIPERAQWWLVVLF